jgi:hypothetical protein
MHTLTFSQNNLIEKQILGKGIFFVAWVVGVWFIWMLWVILRESENLLK